MERIKEINEQAVASVTRVLSKMTGKRVEVTASEVAKKDMLDVFKILNPEDIIAGVYLPVAGDIAGSSLLVFPNEMAFALCDMLLGKKLGTTRRTDEMEEAVLKEIGNVIVGSFLSTFSNILELRMIEGMPEFSYGMASAILEQGVVHFAKRPQNVLLINIAIKIEGTMEKPIVGHLLFIFSTEAEDAIMEILKGK